MKKTLIILVLCVAIAALAAGGVLLYRNSASNDNPVNTSNAVGHDTNSIDAITPVVVSGDRMIGKSITYRNAQFALDTGLLTETFHRKQAPDGSTFVIIFLSPFNAPPQGSLTWTGSEIHLIAVDANVAPTEVSIPSLVNAAGGYLWFTVPESAKNFTLRFGSGETAQTVQIGF